ncbi:hypothetical protein [Seonamhaeicola maritimus]|uniref:STAS/SEC14 domain-containing protein n=1 Tax=Seonamhaeicola maritimus TaxID=2591822 RepID=A0A5C7GDH3_9FLAO|nr:hypothetical protein [Seonamhaeicola maritimus]TXG34760.1 hypothetical protein FUA22_17785 [Seonamhaeicola maritimus]
MKSYKLTFGTINIISGNLAEVIADEGIEMNETLVNEFHDFLLQNLVAPFSLLINRKNSYSYTFQAQRLIGKLKEIKAIAVVIGTSGALMSTETLINLNKDSDWNIYVFQQREKALEWIDKQ